MTVRERESVHVSVGAVDVLAETPVTEGWKVGGEEEGREERSIPKHMQETNTSGTNKRIGSSAYIRIHNITEVGKV